MIISKGSLVGESEVGMTKQIKRLLFAKLSSKRKLAKFLECDLPLTVSTSYVNCFYILLFDENDIFHFEKWVRLDDGFHCREIERYNIDDLERELNLSENWFNPFIDVE